jgi:hypothetical protein
LAILFTVSGVLAQDPKTDRENKPEIKWDVNKEFDEHGNIIRYDSSYSWAWRHHEFPDQEFMDSIFDQFPFGFDHFPDIFEDPDLNREPFWFDPFKGFPDSAWMDSFFPDSFLFEPFGDLCRPHPIPHHPHPYQSPDFHGLDDFLERHHEWLEKFYKGFRFHDDSLYQTLPKWQQLPQHQKKSAREIEI